MQEFISWGKGIIFYLLFVKLMTSILPEGNISKYMKFFSGILLIIILIKPVLNIQNYDQLIKENILKINDEIERCNLENNMETYKNVNDQLAFDIYREKLKENIEIIVEDEGAFLIDLKISFNSYDELKSMDLWITRSSQYDQKIRIDPIEIQDNNKKPYLAEGKNAEDILLEKNIKSRLFNFYNLSSDNINITIEQK